MFGSPSKIKCEFKLPLSKEQYSFDGINWTEQEFLTLSLLGDSFVIEDDGQVYEELIEKCYNEETGQVRVVNNGIKKVELTGEIRFHLLHMCDTEDLWIEFVAWMRDGEVKEIHLCEWSVHENSNRKNQEVLLKNMIEKRAESEKKMSWKIYSVYSWIINQFFGLIKWGLLKIVSLVSFIHRKIS